MSTGAAGAPTHRLLWLQVMCLTVLLIALAVLSLEATEQAGEIRLSTQEKRWIAEHGPVRVGFPGDFAPLFFTEGDVIKGINPDHLRLIGERAGVTFEFVRIPAHHLDDHVLEGKIDMSVAFAIPEREGHVLTTLPLMDIDVFVVGRSDMPPIYGLSALHKKRMAVVKGIRIYTHLLKDFPDIEIYPTDTLEEALAAVTSGQADATMGAMVMMGHLLQDYPTLKILGSAGVSRQSYLYMVRKDLPELVGIINKAIAGTPNEEVDAIIHKWFKVPIETRTDWSTIFRWVAGVSAVFVLILALSLYWNRKLLREISERRSMEEALRENEERFRVTFDKAPVGAAIASADFRLQKVNEEFCRFTGYSAEELEQLTWADITHPDDITADMEQAKRLVAGEIDHYTIEKRYLRKDGQIVWGSLSVRAVENPDGTSSYYIPIVIDITGHKQSKLQLEESELRFRELFDNMRSGVAIYDSPDNGQSFVFKDLNRAGLEYGQKKKEQVIGKDVREIFPGVEALGLLEVFRRVWKTGKPEHHPAGIYKDDQLELWVENYVCKLPCEELVAIYEDSTARKRAEEAQQKLERQLLQAHKMEAIGTLAGGIAHEFNNILGIILGNAELAAADIPDWNPVSMNMAEIKSASFRARDIVRQLLAFSRKAEENRRSVDLASLLQEAVRFLRSSIPTNIEIRQNISEQCHAVAADPTQIHQVLLNLGTNALHAMEEHGGILHFALQNFTLHGDNRDFAARLQPGEYVMLKVSDSGHGIPADVVNRIFEPYFTTKEMGKGTGMGLAVVHGIVESHGGSIQVESRAGAGTTFTIYLPAAPKEYESFEETTQQVPTGCERILFVDDEESIAAIGKSILERLGYAVHIETDAKKALEVFAAEPGKFDLIITDMAMPGLTGDQLISKVLQIRPAMKTILCTGYSEKINEEAAHALGALEYALKPLDTQQLATVVRKALEGNG